MSKLIATPALNEVAAVSAEPARTRVDRNFGLPTGLFVATVVCYLGFVGLMATLFANPGLAIPLVIFAGFIIAAFGLAGWWAWMAPENDTRPLTWGQFVHRGVQTGTGLLTAGQASVQVLILPVLILFW
ncbi:MAG TPA: hypothetical protein PKD92_09955, partial [Novosphingobium sp.]|nr:hypothetical protein [Novosphingobium sp.]